MRIIATLAVIAALFLVGALARQSPQPLQPAAEDASMQGYGEVDRTCQEWTDGCRTCSHGACPNIGIACQPKAITCTKR